MARPIDGSWRNGDGAAWSALAPRPQPQSHRLAAAQGDLVDRTGFRIGQGLDIGDAKDGGERDHRLLQGEGGADADARAGAEGNIGVAINGLAVLGQETLGLEGVGVVPQQLVTLENPRRYDDRGCLLYTSDAADE